MQKWSNFMKESIKYSRILWNLKQILQYSQKHSPKGHMVKLFSDVTKNLFYDKSCVFSKGSTWHRSPCAEMEGNGSKIGF